MKKGKAETAFENLLSRQDYLVVQANDLAKAFGNLKAFEHKLLDYCFSYVTKESTVTDTFKVSSKDILKHFGLTSSGTNYERVARGFKALNENTALYFAETTPDGKRAIVMGQLFSYIKFIEDGEVSFRFSEFAAPYVFALRSQYYSFKLAELSRIKSKYALILMKLWEARRYSGQRVTTIQGDVEEWQEWFLGSDKRWEPARFRAKVLEVGGVELEEKLGVDIFLNTIKNGRKVVGYEMQIIDKRVYDPTVSENEVQTSIYDFLEE